MLVGERRLIRLRELIKSLKAGDTVTKRDMRAVLTAEEMAAHEADWQSGKAFDDDLRKTPEALKSYLLLLRSADALTQRADKMRGKRRAVRLGELAQAAYEHAYENLGEALGIDAGLVDWLDRTVSFTPKNAPELTAEGAPRLKAGRSNNKQVSGFKKVKVRDVKLSTLEAKLAELTAKGKKSKRQEAESAVAENAQGRLARLKKYMSD